MAIRTCFTFTSKTFKSEILEPSSPSEVLGKDAALWMMKELRVHGVAVDENLEQIHSNWWFSFHIGNIKYKICLYWYDYGSNGDEEVWSGWLERDSLVLYLSGFHKKAVRTEAALLIHEVLSASGEVEDVRWYYPKDYYTNYPDDWATRP